MALLPDLLCDAVLNYPLGDTSKTTWLTGMHPHIYPLFNIDTIIKNKVELSEQVVDALKTEFDNNSIGGG